MIKSEHISKTVQEAAAREMLLANGDDPDRVIRHLDDGTPFKMWQQVLPLVAPMVAAALNAWPNGYTTEAREAWPAELILPLSKETRDAN